MLIEFRVENHRSIRDEQVLTLEAGRVGDPADARPRQLPGYADRLLPAALLYGANASGKSNVLAGLAFMRDAVGLSFRFWTPGEGVPREPFAWGPRRVEPSLFEVSFLLDGVRYQYGFVASDERFVEEWLYAWPHQKRQTWYEREGDACKFGEHLKGENKLIEGITRPEALFLSAAAQYGHPQLTPIFSWFLALQPLNLKERSSLSWGWDAEKWLARLLGRDRSDIRQPLLPFPEDAPTKPLLERFGALLKDADIGIVDWRLVQDDRMNSARRRRPSGLIELRHQGPYDDAWLPLEEESRGTQALFRIAPALLQAIQDGSIVLVDELEASLHPALARQILREFNDPATNPRNAQLIATTHDTNLLGTILDEPALRRDQVWFTEKDAEGATSLYPLTDYKPRKAENIERGYLQGRYGAIPLLGDFHLAGDSPAPVGE